MTHVPRRRWGWLLLACCALLPLSVRSAPSIELAPCRLQGGLQAQCGTVDVAEDRSAPQGRRLKLRVAVVPALARTPKADPLFMLAGGPGQAATEGLPDVIAAGFQRVRRTRDVVLVDQRGTGASNPLTCRLVARDAPLGERLTDPGFPPDKLEACLRSADADPRLYTTSIAMQDLDEVRQALGYGAINLWGASYGTRAALVYLREHGAAVRTVILDGVAPPTQRLSLHYASSAQRALEQLFASCAREPACDQAWPDLSARFARLVESLEHSPAAVTLADPLTGAPTHLTVGRDLLTWVLRVSLYQPGVATLVPLLIARAEAGEFAPLVAMASTLEAGMEERLALGMHLSVLCAEDVPRITDDEATAAARGTFLGPGSFRALREGCAHWPRGTPPEGFAEPVRSDAPVLLLSGELDPVTPPSWADEAAQTLPRARHFVAPGVGHGASVVGCAPKLIAEFLDAGDARGLDGACLATLKRPPFFVSVAGPTP